MAKKISASDLELMDKRDSEFPAASDEDLKLLISLALLGKLPRQGLRDPPADYTNNPWLIMGKYWYSHPLLGYYQCRLYSKYLIFNSYTQPKTSYRLANVSDFVGRFRLLDSRYLNFDSKTEWYQCLLSLELPELLITLIIHYLQYPPPPKVFEIRCLNYYLEKPAIASSDMNIWIPLHSFLINDLMIVPPTGYNLKDLLLEAECIFIWDHPSFVSKMISFLNSPIP